MTNMATDFRESLLTSIVPEELIESDGHLGESGFHNLLSRAQKRFLARIEIDCEYKRETGCNVFTAESHTVFLERLRAGDNVTVTFQILDLSNKAVHLIFLMHDGVGKVCASHECLLLHVQRAHDGPKVFPFGRYPLSNLVHMFSKHKSLPRPAGIGRVVSIRRGEEV
jgi:acyl-CoA thioester hydrolase